jgi:hypothetical protein
VRWTALIARPQIGPCLGEIKVVIGLQECAVGCVGFCDPIVDALGTGVDALLNAGGIPIGNASK